MTSTLGLSRWLRPLSAGLVAALVAGCQHGGFGSWDYSSSIVSGSSRAPWLVGSGIESSRDVEADLSSVERLRISNSFDVTVTVGEAAALRVTADENVLDRFHPVVEEGVLRIQLKEGRYKLKTPVRVTLSLPALDGARIDGSGNAQIAGLDSERFVAEVYGSGDIEASGQAGSTTVSIHGSGDVDLRELDAPNAGVSIHGSGDVDLGRVVELDVEIHGSGDVSFDGDPTTKRVRIHGSGDVHRR